MRAHFLSLMSSRPIVILYTAPLCSPSWPTIFAIRAVSSVDFAGALAGAPDVAQDCPIESSAGLIAQSTLQLPSIAESALFD